MTPKEYVETSGKWLYENGFHEVGMNNTIERFGNIAHVFSSYESFRKKQTQLIYERYKQYTVNVRQQKVVCYKFLMQESEKTK